MVNRAAAGLATVLLCALCISLCEAATLSIASFGAAPGSNSSVTILGNQRAINRALAAAGAGDTVLVPTGTFHTVGGLAANGLANVTLLFEGSLSATPNFTAWPVEGRGYVDFLTFTACDGLIITAKDPTAVAIDGNGLPWWNAFIFNKLSGRKRPKMLMVVQSRNILVENLHLINSPSFHMRLEDVAGAEVRFVSVYVDRSVQRPLKKHLTLERRIASTAEGSAPPLQPEDLNTDGIDPSGRDIWIHDCSIVNDDDSIAVKPCSGSCTLSTCSQDMLIENLVLTGFGASIGSVPPHENVNCVRNITFRNITMPETGKGIYIKSNPTCTGNATGIIANILYQDVHIIKPRWWAIWIGPQQQHEPNQKLGRKCSLLYPINSHCPTQGCVQFSNITLQRVTVDDAWLSPGVIMGNATNPMQNVVFDSVVFNNPGWFPFGHEYKCQHAHGRSVNSTPAPCF